MSAGHIYASLDALAGILYSRGVIEIGLDVAVPALVQAGCGKSEEEVMITLECLGRIAQEYIQLDQKGLLRLPQYSGGKRTRVGSLKHSKDLKKRAEEIEGIVKEYVEKFKLEWPNEIFTFEKLYERNFANNASNQTAVETIECNEKQGNVFQDLKRELDVLTGKECEYQLVYEEGSDATLQEMDQECFEYFGCTADVFYNAFKIDIKKQLYCHQIEAIQHLFTGKDVLVTTPTASGKSLIYLIPTLAALMKENSCALFIFPTKALAQDQLKSISQIVDDRFGCAAYDGDLPLSIRKQTIEKSRVLLTNPDMIHVSLGLGDPFRFFLQKVRLIIVDEVHVYHGNLGAHVSNLFRRMMPIFAKNIQFICCSATIGNSKEHIEQLFVDCHRTFEIIYKTGAPRSGKKLMVCNLVSDFSKNYNIKSKRNNLLPQNFTNPYYIAALVVSFFVQNSVKAICFCCTRKACERIFEYTQEILSKRDAHQSLLESVESYRGGYTPSDRRRIEHRLFNGLSTVVISTNALELGIDIGGLAATIHVGFPGSIASFRQQIGRAGRNSRSSDSLAIWIPYRSPVDQFFVKDARAIFTKDPEHRYVNRYTKQILVRHLKCFIKEFNCTKFDFTAKELEVVSELFETDEISEDEFGILHLIDHLTIPSREFGLRSSVGVISVYDEESCVAIDERELGLAVVELFPSAVFVSQGNYFIIQSLDLFKKKRAFAKRVGSKPAYNTTAEYSVKVQQQKILENLKNLFFRGIVSVQTKVFGVNRISRKTGVRLFQERIEPIEYSWTSEAIWIEFPQDIRISVESEGLPWEASIHAAAHAIHGLCKLKIFCSSSDLCVKCSGSRLIIYEKDESKSGLIEAMMVNIRELVQDAYFLLSNCGCALKGCPLCTQSGHCRDGFSGMNSRGAKTILEALISRRQ